MNVPAGWRIRDRYDRHVRRATLRIPPDAPRYRLEFALEEALRLASLPGENEGRTYYFRSLRIGALDASGDRRRWLEKFQQTLLAEAAQAVHGGNPGAEFASVVYFHSQAEALTLLLDRVLARRGMAAWFWPMVMPETMVASGSMGELVPVIVESLRARPASWVAVAAALFGRDTLDVVALLRAVPDAAVESWIEEMSGPGSLPVHAATRMLPAALPVIERAARTFGVSSARTVWIAALAVLAASPSELTRGTAVARARRALATLEIDRARESTPPSGPVPRLSAPPPARTEPAPEYGGAGPAEAPRALPLPQEFPASVPSSPHAAAVPEAPGQPPQQPAASAMPQTSFEIPAPVPVPEALPQSPRLSSIRWHCEGADTGVAGVFFLLNVLVRIGLPAALDAGLAALPDFVPRLLRRFLADGAAPREDPVLRWLDALISDSGDTAEVPCDASCWPVNLPGSRAAAPAGYILRLWHLAVRRWCWRVAGIATREIVSRPGVFSVNLTDLDVSLAIHVADVRIRKAGLDLDPGWLPWFGRVVRFHYLVPGELHG